MNIRHLLLLVSFCALSIFFSGWVYAQVTEAEPIRRTLNFNGIEREYFVRLPKDYEGDQLYWPLVTVHGGGQSTGRSHFLAREIRDEANQIGLEAIVISPSFSNDDPQASRFPSLGEGAFLIAAVRDVAKNFNVRPTILLTGYSRGGQFTHRFALENPHLVEAVAPFAAGTWTCPDGTFLIEKHGEVNDPELFFTAPENATLVPERLNGMFTERVAHVAGRKAHPDSKQVPFLVMCGTLDPRIDIAQDFAQRLSDAGYSVRTQWPRTPHGGRDTKEINA